MSFVDIPAMSPNVYYSPATPWLVALQIAYSMILVMKRSFSSFSDPVITWGIRRPYSAVKENFQCEIAPISPNIGTGALEMAIAL